MLGQKKPSLFREELFRYHVPPKVLLSAVLIKVSPPWDRSVSLRHPKQETQTTKRSFRNQAPANQRERQCFCWPLNSLKKRQQQIK